MRIGFGYDIHPLVRGRPLVLGGVEIPWFKGLLGHSDGDVLIHSIGDAILGACSKGDLGTHFPDKDPKYKGINSLILLKEVMKITNAKIINLDATIVCEEPQLSEYITAMQRTISKAINQSKNSVSIKVKRGEGLDSVGKGKGIASYTVVLIE
ncbi:MAG TPA: 2-C-methyl-D-erythritol 2,4-cyclodiphosphate synthase [bacterium (Candidatus Stahlbacteria)]|nr:2-C-methyl-D-erythritol 2,4-cyclodiphosphate synthase [Candidatus Stahlbacteria bacterium]